MVDGVREGGFSPFSARGAVAGCEALELMEGAMKKGMTRRGFMASVAAAGAVRVLPKVVASSGGRRVLTLVYDKALGAMRAIDVLVP